MMLVTVSMYSFQLHFEISELEEAQRKGCAGSKNAMRQRENKKP
ncbi:hypothetical protein [Photorhabdus khanii]|nr:hypothetical protein [Photorhabdus khanii]